MEDPMLTVEEIVKIDNERHFKGSGITLEQARLALKKILEDKSIRTARIRNTLVIMMPTKENGVLEIHTITADPPELYLGFLLRFLLALHEKEKVKKVWTTITKEKQSKRFKELFGGDVVKVAKHGDLYKMTVDVEKMHNKYAKGVQR